MCNKWGWSNWFLRVYNLEPNKVFVNNIGRIESIYSSPLIKREARKKLNLDLDKFYIIFHGGYYNNDANREAIDIILNDISPKVQDLNIVFLIGGILWADFLQ